MNAGARKVVAAVSAVALLAIALTFAGPPRPAGAHTPHDVIVDVALSPRFAQDRTAYTLSRGRLLKSTDGGDSWRPLTRGIDNRGGLDSIAVDATDPSKLLLSSHGDGVFRSGDAGATWQRSSAGLGTSLNIAFVAFAPSDGRLALAVETFGGRLFLSADGGVSWRRSAVAGITSAASAPDDPRVLVAGDRRGKVVRSVDGGVTWEEPLQLAPYDSRVRAVALSARDGGQRSVFAATEGGGAFRSTDSGRTFEPVATEIDDDRVWSVQLSSGYPTDRTVWLSTSAGGPCRSTDGGDSWTCSDKGLTRNDQADDDAFDRPDFGPLAVAVAARGEATTLFLAGFDGLFRSSDGGDSWKETDTLLPTGVTSLVVVDAGSGKPPTLLLTTYINGAFVSSDGGATWLPSNRGISAEHEWTERPDYVSRLMGAVASPDFEQDGTLFMSMRGYFATSNDRGKSWSPAIPPEIVNPQDSPPDYFFVTVSPDFANDRTVILGTNRGKVFRSTDGGDDFDRLDDLDAGVLAMAISPSFASDDTLFAGTAKGLRRSVDGGRTWAEVGRVDGKIKGIAVSPSFDADATIALGTDSGLLLSRDGGGSFRPVGVPLFGDSAVVEAVALSPDYATDPTILVSLRGLGLYRSADGGDSFEPVGAGLLAAQHVLQNWDLPINGAIVFSPSFATDRTVYGYAGSTLFRSTDAGDTWRTIPRPTTMHDTDPGKAAGKLLVSAEQLTGAAGATPSGRGSPTSPLIALVVATPVSVLLVGWMLRRRAREASR